MGGYKQLPHRPANIPCQDEAFAEVLCAYLTSGGLSFWYPGEGPHQQWLHKLHPAFSLLPWASVLFPLCSHMSAWEHMHTRAPSELLRSDCAMTQGGSARQGQRHQDGQRKPEHGGG